MAEAWIPIIEDGRPVGRVLHPRRVGQLEPAGESHADDPAALILTCANCGAAMDERKCKLICSCGYFLSCSDYY
jgi:hypothetical protein